MLSAANSEIVKLCYNDDSLERRTMVDLIEWKNLERDFGNLISCILFAIMDLMDIFLDFMENL